MVICAYFGLVIVDLGVTSWRRITRPAPEGVAGLPAHSEDQVDAEGQVERRVQELVRPIGVLEGGLWTRLRFSRPVLALIASRPCGCGLSTCDLVVRPHGSPTELVEKVTILSKGDPGNGQSVEKVAVLSAGD